MDDYYMKIGAVKAKEIDGEFYISCWNFSKALSEKEREISDLYKEIDNLEKQISELETKLAKKEVLINLETAIPITKPSPEIASKVAGFSDEEMRELLRKEEPLPFSGEQYEEETKVELPTMPIDVASMLINATVEYQTPSICKVFGAGDTSFADKYSKNDLKEIAEHLLVYCNNSDESEDDTQS